MVDAVTELIRINTLFNPNLYLISFLVGILPLTVLFVTRVW